MLGRIFDAIRHHGRSRRWTQGLAAGRRGEDLAHRFLQSQGYTNRGAELPPGPPAMPKPT